MAGLLFYENENNIEGAEFAISSNRTNKLLGTIYLPYGKFEVAAEAAVDAESAYMAILAKHVEVTATAELLLNSDYDDTDVPVPDGISSSSQTGVYLRE